MSRESTRPQLRTGPLSKRLEERRRAFAAQSRGLPSLSRGLEALSRPNFGVGLIVALVFAASCTLIAIWTRAQPLVAVGRVMTETRLVRVDALSTQDASATSAARERARQRTPRVLSLDAGAIEAIMKDVESLPGAIAGAESLDEIDAGTKERFGLDAARFEKLRSQWAEPSARAPWNEAAQALRAALRVRPLLEPRVHEAAMEGQHISLRLMEGGKQLGLVHRADVIALGPEQTTRAALLSLARDCGFDAHVRDLVVTRLSRSGVSTFAFDSTATARAQDEAERLVPPVTTTHARGEVIFRRGDTLRESQADLYRAEMRAFERQREPWQRALLWTSLALACAGVTVGLATYAVQFAPRITRRASRIMGVALVLLLMLVLACVGSASAPGFLAVTATLPTVAVAVLLSIGYDRRSALAIALLHGLLVCICLRQGVPMMAVITCGVACVVATLREVRDRSSLVRSSVLTGLGLAMATFVFGLIDRPIERESLRNLSSDALLVGVGMLAVGGLTLFVLPLIERAFNVTTGMTLSELRDPRRPLLRELQMRAPGTYTHSLNVAGLVEGAAEAIGADSLLAYVGALYHDVGKMNKPDYFVENQQGGPNRHDKLSPAMSLLVVVGHVKDGMELAREFRLPPRIQHFIESHHGTTLVEYFYHRARQQALARDGEEEGGPNMPDEFGYRYPGPKPRTREAAILMIADAAESAARAIGEPTPAKIESLVREIADRRLRDGQFDDCEITLRDIALIVESISRTLIGMHHARVQYPGPVQEEPPTQLISSQEVQPQSERDRRSA